MTLTHQGVGPPRLAWPCRHMDSCTSKAKDASVSASSHRLSLRYTAARFACTAGLSGLSSRERV